MAKTPEQALADDMLEEAVSAVVSAYGITPPGSLVLDYLVVGEATEFSDDGDSTCNIWIAYKNGHIRLTTALGILELGHKHMRECWGAGEQG